MPAAASQAPWPTPMAGNPGSERYNAAGSTDFSRRAEALCGREVAGVDVSGWPTPRAQDNVQTDLDAIAKAGSSWLGQGRGATVSTMAQMAGWPTATSTDAKGSRNATASRSNAESKHHAGTTLTDAAEMVGWPTATVQDAENVAGASQLNRHTVPLNALVRVALNPWPTPGAYQPGGAQDPEKRRAGGHSVLLQDVATTCRVEGSGTGGESSCAETEKPVRFRLNPRFSLWLMGFPTAWARCAERVTRSSRRSRRCS